MGKINETTYKLDKLAENLENALSASMNGKIEFNSKIF